MKLEDVGILCGITNRTKAYLQVMIENDLIPSNVLIINPEERMPGQGDVDFSRSKYQRSIEGLWKYFNSDIDVYDYLKKNQIIYDVIQTKDVNDPQIISYLSNRPEKIYIYSGFGGAILKRKILNIGKKFLHVHPGKIPEYKGSTTIYYSILKEKRCYVSAIFLAEKLDSGPLIKTIEYDLPEEGESIDYEYDPYMRSQMLLEVLRDYAETGELKADKVKGEGETYFIIHPLLKHIAILSNNRITKKESTKKRLSI